MGGIDDVLARRVKQLRTKLGIPQGQLGTTAGLGERYVNQLENGRHAASLDAADSLAKALGVGLAELLSDGEPRAVRRPVLGRLIAKLGARTDEDLRAIEKLIDAADALRRASPRKRK
jgi:transcriptional regulator with XRE-family HTH domain